MMKITLVCPRRMFYKGSKYLAQIFILLSLADNGIPTYSTFNKCFPISELYQDHPSPHFLSSSAKIIKTKNSIIAATISLFLALTFAARTTIPAPALSPSARVRSQIAHYRRRPPIPALRPIWHNIGQQEVATSSLVPSMLPTLSIFNTPVYGRQCRICIKRHFFGVGRALLRLFKELSASSGHR